MAPIEAIVALSHVEGVTDSARSRELYKYFQPNAPTSASALFPTPPADVDRLPDSNVKSNVTSSKVSSPDTSLTAFCQLVAWRTGAERAMISVIDSATQYFIAESTKTVDLIDNTKHSPGDEIWMGCGSVSKAGRLCERTITVAPTGPGHYPCFIVNDLTKDERFNTLPFVTGSPFLKFYAGVPLVTKRGIPIGSLFIVDSNVRFETNKDGIHFMGIMARTVMRHLEMVREVEEHRRGMKMSRGLASFVEGRAELIEADIEAEELEGTRIAGRFETDSRNAATKIKSASPRASTTSMAGSVSSIERRENEYSKALAKSEEAIFASSDQSEAQSMRPELETKSQPNSFGESNLSVSSPAVDPPYRSSADEALSEASSVKIVCSRAAKLIREAFEVDGAVFYDAQRGFDDSKSQQKRASNSSASSHEHNNASGDDRQSSSEQNSDQGEDRSPQQAGHLPKFGSPDMGDASFSRSSTESNRTVEILGFSTADASSIHGDEYPGTHTFVPLNEKGLQTLLRRYPRGKLWTFDSDGSVSSSSSEEISRSHDKGANQHAREKQRRRMRSMRAKSDAGYLLKHFPGARQLLFVPLWDARRSRWSSGCWAWSTEPTRILSKQNELSFLTAFGNSVMAECSRIDTEIADQKKGDFIGSISHELRSPLHGILASVEFLGDEVKTGFEKRLVETIESCGRTLVDTINHILDFSKINHFEKNWRKTRRRGAWPISTSGGGALALRQSDLPMINLFADVDISVICEEVVEGVFAGHMFQNITAQTFDMIPDARGKMSDLKSLPSSSHPMMGPEHLQDPEVVVILDVDMQNYQYTTQPGAIRRVIMNILGNALKYTSRGYVRIMLEATEMDELNVPGSTETIPRSMVTLTVIDTGKGISSEFLRSKLFTPFAQENQLSSGTGLGLSIVRSIVSLLEGNITIDSELGSGTRVKVTLPLLRRMPKTADSSPSTSKSLPSVTREVDDPVSLLRARVAGQKVSLQGFDLDAKDSVVQQTGQLLKASITNFLTNWYGLQIVPFGQMASIIIVNDASPITISTIISQSTTNRKTPSILVLCSHSSRFDRNFSQPDSKGNVSYVAKPIGPLMLSRALMQCLDGAPHIRTPGLLGPQSAESSDLSNVFEDLSLTPLGGGVLDNSRMAADSDNARKAIESPTPNATTEKRQEFPFQWDDRPLIRKSHSTLGDKESSKPLTVRDNPPRTSTALSETAPIPSPSAQSSIPRLDPPRLLLVDDDKINLTLLRTYMRRRNYAVVDEAENGLEAVKKVESREEGYDIIFTDISMPVLDGFGATRQIRAIEQSRRKKASEENASSEAGDGKDATARRVPALVIALTGLASSRDQNEALTSGIDLFLTKPVALKEVGKMLDNWEANRERDVIESLGTEGSSTAK